MYGAILGDMIGAPYEFDRGGKTKDFPLFCTASQFTDDTVMTVAVAEALLDSRFQADESVKIALVQSMKKWGKKYPHAGYGVRFSIWLRSKDLQPYGSYGNGSAMRVSSAGWLFDTLEETLHMARLTAEVTHNHPEGIKGAEATASAIFLARTGSSKEEIRDYIVREFGYDLSLSCDEIRPGYHHVESCQETVPEAITAFLEGTDFEDVIRTAVSLGGDCDTLTCIAGSIAEAFYGIPARMELECRNRLPEDMIDILGRFDIARGRYPRSSDEIEYAGNACIVEAIKTYYQDSSKQSLIAVLTSIRKRLKEGGRILIPILPPEAIISKIDVDRVKVGDIVKSEESEGFMPQHIQTKDGRMWLVAFTSREEMEKGESTSSISFTIADVFRDFADIRETGFIINPWGQSFLLDKELIKINAEAIRAETKQEQDA